MVKGLAEVFQPLILKGKLGRYVLLDVGVFLNVLGQILLFYNINFSPRGDASAAVLCGNIH